MHREGHGAVGAGLADEDELTRPGPPQHVPLARNREHISSRRHAQHIDPVVGRHDQLGAIGGHERNLIEVALEDDGSLAVEHLDLNDFASDIGGQQITVEGELAVVTTEHIVDLRDRPSVALVGAADLADQDLIIEHHDVEDVVADE